MLTASPRQDNRKLSASAIHDLQPPAKPALRKKESSGSNPNDQRTPSPANRSNQFQTQSPRLHVPKTSAPVAKPKPRTQPMGGISLSDFTKAAGKPELVKPVKHASAAPSFLFASQPHGHKFETPQSHAKSHTKSPPVKPKPTKTNEATVSESIQARKERLWSQGLNSETVPMQKNTSVSASVFDLREIHDQPPLKPKKQFKRTASVDRDIRPAAT
uniref:Uncharacterized protein n=1 Tax=Ciona savignyi TaxID=51511 RepID=H2YBP4_CIOSA